MPEKQKLAAVATVPNPVVAAPLGRTIETGIVQLKITMLPRVAAPSAAHWQSFAASIARIETGGCVAPTVWVDRDLRGATVRIAGRDAATAIRLVRLHAGNSPSPQLWQPHYYEVTVTDSKELL
jgi:hypothetical protein